jgi:diguanylate cyclase (GGDEF)-like protein
VRDDRAVLVVENSQAVAQMVAVYLAERCGRQSEVVRTLAQAREVLKAGEHHGWFAAVVNLELPDAADEEIVTLTLTHGVPTVVLTGTFSEVKRRRILRHDIVDYCLKGKTGIDALVRVIDRLQKNPGLKVMVVDDDAASRAQHVGLLRSQRFEVLQAATKEQALELYREHKELVLVMVALGATAQAIGLVSELRELATPDELGIMALSNLQTPHAAAEHLKAGASDFLAKPFEKEEYFCRVYSCVDRVDNMRRIKQLAFVDGLTGVANRLAFFGQVPLQLAEATHDQGRPAVALVSIDQLNAINDKHGYQAGDQVLTHVARSLASNLGPDAFCARFTGQQFSVFLRSTSAGALSKLFERARASVERSTVTFQSQKLTVTVSCGVVCCEADESLDGYINRADSALEEAETAGGNCVVLRA